MQAVADLKQFVQFFADHQHGAAGVAQFQNFAANLRRRAHINAPGWLRHDKQPGLGIDLAAHDKFLQIAARQGTRRRVRAAGLHVEAPDDVGGLRMELPDPNPAAGKARERNGFIARQQQVVRQSQGGHGSAAQALLRHKMKAKLAPPARVQARCVGFANADRGRWRPRVLARQGIQQLLLAVAGDPGNAHHLARAHLQRDAGQVNSKLVLARQLQVLHAQHRRTGPGRAPGQLRRLGADHHARQRCVGFLGRVAHAGNLAPAQHRAGIAQLANFMQLVTDIQNAAALAGQLFQHHKQLFHGLRGEHRRRFVQDEDFRAGEQGANDFHPLHLPHAQGMHRAGRVDFKPVLQRLAENAGGHLLKRTAGQPQPHVLGHGHGVKQVEMLEHHADPVGPRLLGTAKLDQLPVEHHPPGIRLDRAVNNFHQGRLAGAVFAQHGMGLAGHDRQRHIAVGHHAGVALADAFQMQSGCGHVAVVLCRCWDRGHISSS